LAVSKGGGSRKQKLSRKKIIGKDEVFFEKLMLSA